MCDALAKGIVHRCRAYSQKDRFNSDRSRHNSTNEQIEQNEHKYQQVKSFSTNSWTSFLQDNRYGIFITKKSSLEYFPVIVVPSLTPNFDYASLDSTKLVSHHKRTYTGVIPGDTLYIGIKWRSPFFFVAAGISVYFFYKNVCVQATAADWWISFTYLANPTG